MMKQTIAAVDLIVFELLLRSNIVAVPYSGLSPPLSEPECGTSELLWLLTGYLTFSLAN
jgi:hypothetical protein